MQVLSTESGFRRSSRRAKADKRNTDLLVMSYYYIIFFRSCIAVFRKKEKASRPSRNYQNNFVTLLLIHRFLKLAKAKKACHNVILVVLNLRTFDGRSFSSPSATAVFFDRKPPLF